MRLGIMCRSVVRLTRMTVCGSCLHHLPIFCRVPHNTVTRQYLVKADGLQYVSSVNPHNRANGRMRLYNFSDVADRVLSTYGNVDGFLKRTAEKNRRADQKRKREREVAALTHRGVGYARTGSERAVPGHRQRTCF